jgi:hypothetical protein
VDDLGTIDDILGLQELVPPPGLFKSTRVGKGRGRPDEQSAQANDSSSSKPPTTVTRTYAPFPTLHNRYPSQSESPPASESVMMYEPYENMSFAGYANSDGPSPRYSSPPPPHHHTPVSSISPPQSSHIAQYGPVPLTAPYRVTNQPSSTFHHIHNSSVPTHRKLSPIMPSVSPAPASYELSPHNQQPSIYSPIPQMHRSLSPKSPTGTSVQPVYTDGLSRLYSPKHAPASYPHGRVPSSYSYPGPSTNPPFIPPDHQERLPPLHTTLPDYIEYNAPASASVYGVQSPFARPISDLNTPSYELLSSRDPRNPEVRRGSIGPDRDLAPIYSLTRAHPYRRDPLDDKTLRLLTPRSS